MTGPGTVARKVTTPGEPAGTGDGGARRTPGGRRRRKPSWQRRPIPYLPPLDGLRAVAVAMVVAYHLGYAGAAGGFVGVEVFFVLSGWLVCALLVNEHHRTDRIDLRAFWLRRARRLLPAVVAVTGAALAATAVARSERLAALRSDAVAGLAYHLNWRLVLDERSYFEAAAGPSALEHLWSLSIEEQFYLTFPLLCVVLVRGSRRRAVVALLALAAASTVLRFALVDPGADPSRAYFGADTRAAGLLLGAAVAFVWTPNRLRPHDDPPFTALLDAVAAAGAAVLLWYVVAVDEHRAVAFEGGLTAAQLATLAIVAAVVYPAPSRAARLLSVRPLRWVGERSYGIYLLHWPVIVLTSRAPGEQPETPLRVAGQLAATLALAAASHRYLEAPVRRAGLVGAARAAGRHLHRVLVERPLARPALAAGGLLAVTAGGTIAHDVLTATGPAVSEPTSVAIAGEPAAPSTTTPAAPDPAAGTTIPTTDVPAPSSPAGAHVPTTAVGDSVMVGAAPVLAERLGPALTVDAEVGRQMEDAAAVVRDLAAAGRLGEVVVLHLGNNGPFDAGLLDEVLATIGPERKVLLVTVAVPRRWEGEVNRQLAAAADRHPNVVLLDWRGLATTEPGLTREDGYHLTAAGAQRYADLVVGQVPQA
ncbi:MAG TPA: acyltransferase family protein [Acidimicrobiales bacterium]|nr:acyltransferase family protein [Acidimicrobiales bacterium]